MVDTPPDIAVGTAGLGSLEELTKVRLSLLRCVCMCVVCVVVVCVCYVRACVCVCVRVLRGQAFLPGIEFQQVLQTAMFDQTTGLFF